MTPRRLLAFGVVAVVAFTAAVLLANHRSASSSTERQRLYPQLKSQADSVKAIRIFKAGDVRAVELVRNGDRWTLTERSSHPAAAVKARKLVQALVDAKLVEEKTSDPEKYSALDVQDVKDANAKGVRIELDGPATEIKLIVGKDGAGGKSSYVRRAGDKQSWLVSEILSASPEPRDWLEKEIINISADRVQSTTVAIEGQKPYTATKASRADADFKVEPLPKGKELNSPAAANGAATALMNLSLDDVQPQAALASAKPDAHATFKTFDGLVVELDGYKQDDKHFVVLKPSFDKALAEQFKIKTAEDDKTKASSPQTDVQAEAKTLGERVAQWAYELPSYKYEAIFRPLDGLLKK